MKNGNEILDMAEKEAAYWHKVGRVEPCPPLAVQLFAEEVIRLNKLVADSETERLRGIISEVKVIADMLGAWMCQKCDNRESGVDYCLSECHGVELLQLLYMCDINGKADDAPQVAGFEGTE